MKAVRSLSRDNWRRTLLLWTAHVDKRTCRSIGISAIQTHGRTHTGRDSSRYRDRQRGISETVAGRTCGLLLSGERLIDVRLTLQFDAFIVVSMATDCSVWTLAGSAGICRRQSSSRAIVVVARRPTTNDVVFVVLLVFVEWPTAAIWRHLVLVVVVISFHQLANSINVTRRRCRRLLINCMTHRAHHWHAQSSCLLLHLSAVSTQTIANDIQQQRYMYTGRSAYYRTRIISWSRCTSNIISAVLYVPLSHAP